MQQIAGELERSLADAHGDKQRLQEENLALKVDINSKKEQSARLEKKVIIISRQCFGVTAMLSTSSRTPDKE